MFSFTQLVKNVFDRVRVFPGVDDAMPAHFNSLCLLVYNYRVLLVVVVKGFVLSPIIMVTVLGLIEVFVGFETFTFSMILGALCPVVVGVVAFLLLKVCLLRTDQHLLGVVFYTCWLWGERVKSGLKSNSLPSNSPIKGTVLVLRGNLLSTVIHLGQLNKQFGKRVDVSCFVNHVLRVASWKDPSEMVGVLFDQVGKDESQLVSLLDVYTSLYAGFVDAAYVGVRLRVGHVPGENTGVDQWASYVESHNVLVMSLRVLVEEAEVKLNESVV